jgi:hypothetical protein
MDAIFIDLGALFFLLLGLFRDRAWAFRQQHWLPTSLVSRERWREAHDLESTKGRWNFAIFTIIAWIGFGAMTLALVVVLVR